MEFPMSTVNVHAVKTHLSRLVDEAAAGAEIIIAKAGKPLAKLVSLDAAPKTRRTLGLLAGKAVIPPGFDDPLPEDMLRQFEGR
jgi:prevent-host-death family protein